MTLNKLVKLWQKFGDVPTNNDEEIEQGFLHFKKGTDRLEVWHWFDEEIAKIDNRLNLNYLFERG